MNDDLRWLLEYGDEELLNWLELIANPAFRRLGFDDQHEVLACAMRHGEKAALDVRELAGKVAGRGVGHRAGAGISAGVDVDLGAVVGSGAVAAAGSGAAVTGELVRDLAAALGVKDIVYGVTPGGPLGVRAEYSPSNQTITVYEDSIDRLYQQMLDLRAVYFTRPQLEKIHIAHELYHHLEEKHGARTDALVRRETGQRHLTAQVREVGAYTFANRLLGLQVPCQVLNLLGMLYGWKVLRCEAQKYIENLAIRDRRAAL